MRQLSVDMFSTVDGYGGSSGPDTPPVLGVRGARAVQVDPRAAGQGSRRAHGGEHLTVVAEPVETAVPALKAMDDTPMRTIGSASLVRSLFRLGLVDRVRVRVFPTGAARLPRRRPARRPGMIPG